MNINLIPATCAFLVLIALLLAGAVADEVKLEPNAKFTFEFPELPETFFSKSTHESVPAMLTAQLPENYSAAGKYPLFVFLEGGNGGRGDSTQGRAIVGLRDFITVSMPLFRDASGAKPPPIPGLPLPFNFGYMVNLNDAPVLGKSYRTMLEKLFAAVPNIATERSAFGGFSNGAHATGALLAAKDEFITSHFKAYCFFEGGLALALDPSALEQPALRDSRFITFYGDHDNDPKLQVQRTLIGEPLFQKIQDQAATLHLDYQRIVMHGYGHQMPPEYKKMLGQWIRGEQLVERNPE
jgi:hypothetical protein